MGPHHRWNTGRDGRLPTCLAKSNEIVTGYSDGVPPAAAAASCRRTLLFDSCRSPARFPTRISQKNGPRL
jgi:hypothetical protein